jgi:hypothetical protein
MNYVPGETLKVGPGEKFVFPSVVAQFAKDGDLIEIDAQGMYFGDEAIWNTDNLVIRGVNGTPVLKSQGNIKNGKGIWVVKGDNIIIENIEFSGAKVRDKNGAGIRMEGVGLTVRNCKFIENENGILAGANPQSDIVIEYSEFAKNGHGKGQTHNLYIGHVNSLVFQYNYSHHAVIGHNLKSRAQKNYILYNRIMDEESGNSSYAVDLPNGGMSFLVGNIIQQGENTDNASIIAYGVEGITNSSKKLFMVDNTIVNQRKGGIFVKVSRDAEVKAFNNIFAGSGKLTNEKIVEDYNIFTKNMNMFRNINNFDFHLVASANAIDVGKNFKKIGGFLLTPKFEYAHPSNRKIRQIKNNIDVGALEYTSDPYFK